MDNNQFHQSQIEQQVTSNIIKGAIYNQRMAQLSDNTEPTYHSSYNTAMGGFYETKRKVYKGQRLALGISLFIGIVAVLLVTFLFS